MLIKVIVKENIAIPLAGESLDFNSENFTISEFLEQASKLLGIKGKKVFDS